MKRKTWKGLGIVPGIQKGLLAKRIHQAAVLQESGDSVKEQLRFEEALQRLKENLQKKAEDQSLGETEAAIFESHQTMLEDPEWQQEIKDSIQQHRWDAVYAVEQVSSSMAGLLEELEDPYLKERAQDIRDISASLQREMQGREDSLDHLAGCILLTGELRPSEVMDYCKAKVAGVLAFAGGKTSHAALLAKSKNLTYISGLPQELMTLEEGSFLAIDGEEGDVFFQPEEEVLRHLEEKQEQQAYWAKQHDKVKFLPGKSRDGIKRTASANIANQEDVLQAIQSGAEGIALFRTEFLFLDRKTLPGEEEQFQLYRQVARAMEGKSVIVRTMDIGGDKGSEAFFPQKEENPFLGLRGIRFAFERRDLFFTQLRALLRGATEGNLKIMFPMVTEVEDMIRGKALLEEAKASLRKEGTPFREDLAVGAMIEVPSAALCAGALAQEADFFSIGTNDLMQYTLAADRMNTKVQEWYDPYNPGFLRLIALCAGEAQAKGIHLGMCGDLAGEEKLIPLWNALGIQEYGVAAPKIGALKYALSQSDAQGREAWVQAVLSGGSAGEVLERLKQ